MRNPKQNANEKRELRKMNKSELTDYNPTNLINQNLTLYSSVSN